MCIFCDSGCRFCGHEAMLRFEKRLSTRGERGGYNVPKKKIIAQQEQEAFQSYRSIHPPKKYSSSAYEGWIQIVEELDLFS